MEETTTIRVYTADAEKLKELFPHLRNDAYRLAEILRGWRVMSIDTLPGPADADLPAVVTVRSEEK